MSVVDKRPEENCPIVIGAGLAGLMAALHMAPEPVLVLSRSALGQDSASGWAQGGLAAAIGPDDSTALHLADTLAAGDGLCDPAIAARIVGAGPALVDEFAAAGAAFDRDASGRIGLGLEAGHGRRRIVHAAGDASGREILRAMIAAVRRTPSITVWEGVSAIRLVLRDGAVAGVLAQETGADGSDRGSPRVLRSSRVVIATGGMGGLYEHTTNPRGATGQGLMLAARAGARLVDLEFVQFHPTAFDSGADPMPLISEAVRGEGAVLVDETGYRFMAGLGRAELEPRDVVSRAVWRHSQAGHRVFLDASRAMGARFATRFPGIAAVCRQAGIDPCLQPIPILPAAHYHMGGIAVDGEGRSSVAGLWACGEAAGTGLHGANRLASNSLLEAAVTGTWVARSVAGTPARRAAPMAPVLPVVADDPTPVRAVLSRHAGVLRDGEGLRAAVAALAPMQGDAAALGLMLCVAMLRRQESRGGHARTDFPGTSPALARRTTLTLDEALRAAQGTPARQEPPARSSTTLKPAG